VESVKYPGDIQIQKPPIVTAMLIPDTPNAFVIETGDLSGGLLSDTAQQFNLDDYGMLTGVDSEMKDQTAQAVKEFAAAAVTIAGSVRELPEPTPADLLQQQIDGVSSQIAKGSPDSTDTIEASRGLPSPPSTMPTEDSRTKTANAPSTEPSIAAKPDAPLFDDPYRNGLWRQANALRTVLDSYKRDHQRVEDQCDTECVVFADPQQFTPAKDGSLEYTITPPQPFKGIELPDIVVKLVDPPPNPAEPKETSFDGIVFRPARVVETRLLLGTDAGQLLYTGFISYPQYSPFFTVHIRSRAFSDSVTALQFSPGGGGLRSMNTHEGNAATGAGQAANDVGAAVHEAAHQSSAGNAPSQSPPSNPAAAP
jgi:hypothetical protein